jgi:hypothetical protein
MPIILGKDSSIVQPGGGAVTLADIEQEVARRTGPFFQAAQDSGTPTSSTTTSALMPSLKTNALLGGPENLWLIRRGVRLDGTVTPSPITAADRERLVQTFDSGAGRVIVDRNWGTPMYPSELADFTHLHPSQELRVAVLAGLRRCFFEDRGRVYMNSSSGIDLTATLPWLTDGSQILRARGGWQGTGPDLPFEAVHQAGHVLLIGVNVAGGSWVSAMRPHFSWVNGMDSTTGPQHDDDTLDVDLDYAAAAGHIEAWHLFPSRMYAAAAGNLQASQEMAAREFTRQAMIWAPRASGGIGFSETVRVPLVGV